MTNRFIYNTTGNVNNNVPAPLYSDFDHRSPTAQKMIAAKQASDQNYWQVMREVFLHDYNTLPRSRFRVWASTMSIPFMTRHRIFDYVCVVLEAAKKDERYMHALEESMVGYGSLEDFLIFSMFEDFKTTMNRIQYLAHLIICGYTPDKLSGLNTITEIGGGIGEMAEIVCKLGFKGKYVIYDFPEISNLQRYLHTQLGLNNITYTDDYNQLADSDLCIGTWSFTEMPLDLRDKIVSKIGGSSEWLLAYSRNIFGIDNQKYIEESFLPSLQEHTATFIDIPSMPWDGGARYLTIKQKTV